MAQIIKHRRGSLEGLSAVTASVQKGELLIATGSSNLTTVNGASLVFAAAADGQIQAVNRFLQGNSAPSTFANSTYNGLVNGVPYYDSGSGTLYLLGSNANTAINLVGNIQPFSASVDSRLISVEASLGGGGSIGTRVAALETFSGSQLQKDSTLATYTASIDTRLTQIGVVSGSLISSASAASVSITNLNASSASQQISIDNLNSFSASANIRFTEIGVVSGSLIASASAAKTTNDAQGVSITNLNTFSASVNTSVSALNSSSASQQVSIDNLNSFSSSQLSQNSALATYTGSVNTRFTTLATLTGSYDTRFTTLGTYTASVDSRFTTLASYTASNDTTNTTQNSRLTSLENRTGSYATTGSNIFQGTQVITGSLFVTANLVVQGSSSLQNITASAVDIGTNIVKLNTNTPAVRFAGIQVVDSGSQAATGSLLWDSLNNHWLYVHPSASGEGYNSAIFIAGPKNTGAIGEEATLTSGSIPVAVGEDHIDNSIMTQNAGATKITITGGLDVTGTISGSIQGIGNVTAYSTSVDSRLVSVETSLGGGGSIGTRVAALETFSGSQLQKDSTLQTYTSSLETRLTQVGTVSGSLILSASAANVSITNLNLSSASQQVSIDNLNSFSSSANSRFNTISTVTSSYDSRFSTLATYTGSVDSRFTTISSVTASYDSRFSTLATYTGSVNTSITNLNASSASQQISIDNLNSFSASENSKASALATYTGSVDSRFSTLGTYTSSLETRMSAVSTVTASLISSASVDQTRFTTLATYTGSVDSRFTTLGTYTASVDSRFSTLATLTGSIATEQTTQNTRLSNIETFTSSFGTTFSSSVDSRLDVLEGNVGQALNTNSEVTFAKITTSGNAIIGGDLVVQGNTVTLNTSQLVVEDKLITLASGSSVSATSDGSGIEVAGAGANFVYQHSTTAFTSSVALIAPSVTASVNLGTAAGNSKRIAFRNTNGNLDLVPTASVSGDLLQWNGTDFVMSNVIDGGSF